MDEEGSVREVTEERWYQSKYKVAILISICLFTAAGIVGLAVNIWTTYANAQNGIPTPVGPVPDSNSYHPLILISCDGFRWDYLGRTATPNIDRLISRGVRAKSMRPSFPSKTFPNHYTLVTGLYPAHHGIIDNTMYDPVFNAWFSLSNAAAVTNGRWWGGEPFWVTCEKNNIKSGTYFWPGSEAEIMGYRPSYYTTYDGGVPLASRVNTILSWMDLPVSERPSFFTLYMEDVDHEGHATGPNSPGIAVMVARMDAALGLLLEGLEARGLYDNANMIFTADHGMTQLDYDRRINLNDYINIADDVTVVTYYPVLNIIPRPGKSDKVYNQLVNAHPNLTVWHNYTVPERFHFTDNRRIGEIVGLASLGWAIVRDNGGLYGQLGNHGFDNMENDMAAIFIASGPAFKSNVTVDTFSNVNVYSLMAHVMNVTGAPNDGSIENVRHMLA